MIHAGLDSPRPKGVGLVIGADGRPKIKPGWLERLPPEQRAWVEQLLAERGNLKPLEDDNGNSERRGR